MSVRTNRFALAATTPHQVGPRAFAIAALLGATMLAMPLAAAAQTTPQSTTSPSSTAPAHTPRTAAGKAASSQPETVEQRITSLHRQLKITSAEETAWNAVAQAMRDNATQMQQLMQQREADTSGQPMTAVDDLNMYQKFAQAHADGLKNLVSSFDTLYNAMPDPQKKLADQVFSSARRERG